MAKIIGYVKLLIVLSVLASGVGCEEPPTGAAERPDVPLSVKGDDARVLVWAPKATDKKPFEPVFSPDGRKVAVSYRYAQFNRDADLAIYDLGKREVRVIVEGNCARRPSWSPTGEWIAYQSDREPKRYIWLVKPDGSEHHQLEIGTEFGCFKPFWGSGGDRLYFLIDSEDHRRLDAAYYDFNNKELKRFHVSAELNHRAAVPAPGGAEVAINLFNDNYEVTDIILALIRDTGEDFRIVWRAEEGEVGWPIDWSPSGRYILISYAGARSGQQGLWTFEVKTNKVKQLTMCPPDADYESVARASWGPNGSIVFEASEGKLYSIKAPE